MRQNKSRRLGRVFKFVMFKITHMLRVKVSGNCGLFKRCLKLCELTALQPLLNIEAGVVSYTAGEIPVDNRKCDGILELNGVDVALIEDSKSPKEVEKDVIRWLDIVQKENLYVYGFHYKISRVYGSNVLTISTKLSKVINEKIVILSLEILYNPYLIGGVYV